MANGILAALAGGLSGYSGALSNQYKMQKEDEQAKLKSERLTSLEELRASNNAKLQETKFTQSKELINIGETNRATALTKEREYQGEQLTAKKEYDEGALKRAYEAKQEIITLDMDKYSKANPVATPEQLDDHHQILQGWAIATKGLSADKAAELKLKAQGMWEDLDPKLRDKKIAQYKNLNRNSLNPSEDAMLEFMNVAISNRKGGSDSDTGAADIKGLAKQYSGAKDKVKAYNMVLDKFGKDVADQVKLQGTVEEGPEVPKTQIQKELDIIGPAAKKLLDKTKPSPTSPRRQQGILDGSGWGKSKFLEGLNR